MVAIGEDLGLVGQVRAAAVDEVDARQAVCGGDFLRADVLLHGHREVSAALHRRVVGEDHALAARNAANAGDHARAGHFIAVHAIGRELAQFEERRAWIEQSLHPITRQQLAARDMPGA